MITPLWYVASMLFHLAVAGVIYWAASTGGAPSVNSGGDVIQPTNVQWINFSATPNTSSSQSANLRVGFNDLVAAVDANYSAYPTLGAVVSPGYFDTEVINGTNMNSTKVTVPLPGAGSNYCTGYIGGVNNTLVQKCFGYTTHSETIYTWYPLGQAIPTGQPDGVAAAVNASPEIFSGDIDNLIKSNPNICHFDTPSSPGTGSSAGSLSIPSAPTAGQVSGSPQSPGNGGTLTGPAGSTPNQPVTPGAPATTTTGTAAPGAYGDGTDYSSQFGTRLTAFNTAMSGSAMFGAPASIIGTIPGSSTSSWSCSTTTFGTLTLDLLPYSTQFAMVGVFLKIVCGFGCLMLVMKGTTA